MENKQNSVGAQSTDEVPVIKPDNDKVQKQPGSKKKRKRKQSGTSQKSGTTQKEGKALSKEPIASVDEVKDADAQQDLGIQQDAAKNTVETLFAPTDDLDALTEIAQEKFVIATEATTNSNSGQGELLPDTAERSDSIASSEEEQERAFDAAIEDLGFSQLETENPEDKLEELPDNPVAEKESETGSFEEIILEENVPEVDAAEDVLPEEDASEVEETEERILEENACVAKLIEGSATEENSREAVLAEQDGAEKPKVTPTKEISTKQPKGFFAKLWGRKSKAPQAIADETATVESRLSPQEAEEPDTFVSKENAESNEETAEIEFSHLGEDTEDTKEETDATEQKVADAQEIDIKEDAVAMSAEPVLPKAEESAGETEIEEEPQAPALSEEQFAEDAAMQDLTQSLLGHASSLPLEEQDIADSDALASSQKESTKRPRKKHKITGFKVFVSLTALFTFASAVFIWLLFLLSDNALLHSKPEVALPNFYGENAENVLKDPKYALFDLEIKSVYSNDYPAGTVISQIPKPPKNVKEDAHIVLRVSAGEHMVTVPNIVGKIRDDAKLALKDANLYMMVKQEISETKEVGTVLHTEPKAGAIVKAGETIVVYVARAEQAYSSTVPDCIGLSTTKAGQRLSNNGLSVGGIKQVASTEEKGTVLEQWPAPGKILPRGSSVSLTVSDGGALPADLANSDHEHNFVTTHEEPKGDSVGFDLHTCTICGGSYLDNVVMPH